MPHPPHLPWALGLDLGSNSIGWAALRLAGDDPGAAPVGLLHPPSEMGRWPSLGVRLFREGVEDYGKGEKEHTRNQERRQMRHMRRQLLRRSRRLTKIYHLLASLGLLPEIGADAVQSMGGFEPARDAALKALDRRIAERRAAAAPEEAKFIRRLLPYFLRSRALMERLEPEELGRALYHLAQRRGFQSNRKSARREDEELGKVHAGIQDLARSMEGDNAESLGQHLYLLACRSQRADAFRLRRRWTSRAMYLQEFDLILDRQAKYSGSVLSPESRKRLWNAIFHQRPLRSMSDTIGECELESGRDRVMPATGEVVSTNRRKRAPEFFLISQRFRIWQSLAHLRLAESPGDPERVMTEEERQRLFAALDEAPRLSFSEVKRVLGLPARTKFNLQRGGETRLPGNRTQADFLQVFGSRWRGLSAAQQDTVVVEVWGAAGDEHLAQRIQSGTGPWRGLQPTAADAKRVLEVVRCPDEYMSLSRRAMERLLPRLMRGEAYMTAVRAEYGDAILPEAATELPPLDDVVPELRNPTVARTLHELRRVVNQLIRLYGKPQRVVIEFARDLKQSRKDRKKLQEQMRSREAERTKAADRILAEIPRLNPDSRADKEKVLLWEEQGCECMYTGRPISAMDLANGAVDVDHIIPFSRSLDDSFLNKAVCFSEFNRDIKRNRTPWEAFQGDEAGWNSMVERLKRRVSQKAMSEAKQKRYLLHGPELEEFLAGFRSSQLNDTRYVSKLARRYLMSLYGGNADTAVDLSDRIRVFVGNGQLTAMLRRALGVQRLWLLPRDEDKREDVRHHALDAVFISLCSPAMMQAVASRAEDGSEGRRGWIAALEDPWERFAEDLNAYLERLIPSRKVSAPVRGALHLQTHYSPPRCERGGRAAEGAFVHVRKPLEAMSSKEIEQIVDPGVRACVIAHLAGRTPAKVFDPKDPSTYPMHANDNRILRARTRVKGRFHEFGSASHRKRWAATDENHHAEIVKEVRGGKEVWTARVVSLAEAMARRAEGLPIVDRSGHFVCTLQKGDCIQFDDGERFFVRGFSAKSDGRREFTFGKLVKQREFFESPNGERKALVAGRTALDHKLGDRGCRKFVISPIGVASPSRA